MFVCLWHRHWPLATILLVCGVCTEQCDQISQIFGNIFKIFGIYLKVYLGSSIGQNVLMILAFYAFWQIFTFVNDKNLNK